VPGGGPVEETAIDQFRQVMETNFFGGLRCIKAVIPSMRERRKGTIVNITSIAGRLASAPMASYAASNGPSRRSARSSPRSSAPSMCASPS
jgi:NAD(P)-dependent dehydrogenase (short-subunit alcohol dehydrogenase family)